MHFVVTARITPFNPGASPPPVSIPTLRTSAIGSSFVQRVEKISLAKPLPENARRSAERGVGNSSTVKRRLICVSAFFGVYSAFNAVALRPGIRGPPTRDRRNTSSGILVSDLADRTRAAIRVRETAFDEESQ